MYVLIWTLTNTNTGTRPAARVLSEARIEVYLYPFSHHFEWYINPESPQCQTDSEALCGTVCIMRRSLLQVWARLSKNLKVNQKKTAPRRRRVAT
jgi:hypothetical protein